MPTTIYVGSESDNAVLQRTVEGEKKRNRGGPIPAAEDKPHQAPEVHVVKVPSTGIDARAGNTIFAERCEVYKLVPTPGVDDILTIEKLGEYEIPVFNLAETKTQPGYRIARREKSGFWLVEQLVFPVRAKALLGGTICGEPGTGTSSGTIEAGTGTGTGECDFEDAERVSISCFQTTDVVSSLSVLTAVNPYRLCGDAGDIIELGYDANTDEWYISTVKRKQKQVVTLHRTNGDCIELQYSLICIEECSIEPEWEELLCAVLCPSTGTGS